MSNLIEAANISLARGGQNILDNVSLSLTQGEFTTIVGPNGAGKTMLLQCLLKLTSPDSGTITHAPNVKIGYVPQDIADSQSMPMSVKRFLSLNQKLSPATIAETMEETKITSLADKSLHVLSSGELQRVLLARALARNPDVLMLDEPAQNLDINGQLYFYNLIDDIFARRKIAILMVSHDLHLVMSSTHRVVCLYHHICCSGQPESVRNDPHFKELFGDDMSRLMSIYTHEHNHTHEEIS